MVRSTAHTHSKSFRYWAVYRCVAASQCGCDADISRFGVGNSVDNEGGKKSVCRQSKSVLVWCSALTPQVSAVVERPHLRVTCETWGVLIVWHGPMCARL